MLELNFLIVLFLTSLCSESYFKNMIHFLTKILHEKINTTIKLFSLVMTQIEMSVWHFKSSYVLCKLTHDLFVLLAVFLLPHFFK